MLQAGHCLDVIAFASLLLKFKFMKPDNTKSLFTRFALKVKIFFIKLGIFSTFALSRIFALNVRMVY